MRPDPDVVLEQIATSSVASHIVVVLPILLGIVLAFDWVNAEGQPT